MPTKQRKGAAIRKLISILITMETDIYQMEEVHQNHFKKSLELQLYDFREFPDINTDRYEIITERSVSGELMKSGNHRPKNAISFIMQCDTSQDFHDCIDHFVIEFIQKEFSVSFLKSLECSQSFVRFRLPAQSDEELQDFSISSEVMKILLDRSIHLDFWFFR